MSSLAKRATPSQARVMRMVQGAVKNAIDHHPDWEIDRRFCRSIAKRAAGTLTADWPETLAAVKAAGQTEDGNTSACRSSPPSRNRNRRNGGGGSYLSPALPLDRLWKILSIRAREAKRANQQERLAEIIALLKIVDGLRRAE